MRRAGGVMRRAAVAAAGLVLLAGCGGGGQDGKDDGAGKGERPGGPARGASATTHLKNIPGIGTALRSRIPVGSRQVVAVYGKAADSADATVVLYEKGPKGWDRKGSWPAHNGRRGWTTDHHEDDKRSPVGVFTLTDAGGVLADPGAKLPYTHSTAFTPPSYWSKNTRHDFDYVIAINYNRVKGASPLDPTRPEGQSKGGGVWLHLDHGSGTSACVSVSKSAMQTLLRTLDPARQPVVVMGDAGHLAA
ncbi:MULTISPECIES: L,D-transpeptidase family protein [Streptomyces]|uniref:L,D-transpeptidase family protein n=1 Tax=Streptomyces siderophoricus TaxID=2802281 RepID=A0ABS1MZ98_9ACTN|nr:L,D-transpeptidase family protein [Streptomyces sp. 9-7]MBL1093107.1 L,D-transpeptidase family protein [Streptomyces sp. 9-7]